MKKTKRFMALFLILVLTLAFVPEYSTVKAAGSSGITTSVEKVWQNNEWGVLQHTNQKRMAKGLLPYSTIKALQQAASLRAQEITEVFSHSRPDGTSCSTAFSEFGISYRWWGENIAAGQSTPAAALDSWMNSPGHRETILFKNYNHMGAGYASVNKGYRHYWTQMFIGGCQITKIAVGSILAMPTFGQGRDIEDQNLIILLTCDHGMAYMPLISGMCSGYDKNSLEVQTVTVTYGNYKTSFSFTLTNVSNNLITNAGTPKITSQPKGKSLKRKARHTLKVRAKAAAIQKGSSKLSYQWYRNTKKNVFSGKKIKGATKRNYKVPTKSKGTRYYYCIITNMDNKATGNRKAAVTSKAAKVVVK